MNDKVDFDAFAKDYDEIMAAQLKGFGEESAYFAEYKVRLVKERLRKSASTLPKTILEYGCGTGRNLTFLKEHFPDAVIEGCDISAESLNVAAKRMPDARLYQMREEMPKKQYDLVFVACVFHHIAPEERASAFEQIRALMKPSGELFIFEHNPYNPVTRRIVNACPFDKDAILLPPAELASRAKDAGLKVLENRYALFYPAPLKALRPTEAYLGWLPLGGQYYIRAVK
ncbi:MAG: methyltransferase domain-containing protein [Chloroherpetonaceae bacterium]|nr:methyltransferase domain-containing protein [Chloroherpetonaceae bacterium]